MMNQDGNAPMDLRVRTRLFAMRIIRLYNAMPKHTVAQTLGRQILRSGTSVGAQYREGVRARSNAEVVSKWGGALQELEETAYWLELLQDAEVFPATKLCELSSECDELIAILTASVKTVKARQHGKVNT